MMNEALWKRNDSIARIRVSENIELRLLSSRDVKHLHDLQCLNAKDLKPWLAWAEIEQTIKATNDFVAHTVAAAKRRNEYHYGIHVGSELSGVLGLAPIDYRNRTATVGFWIGKKYWGKGVVCISLRMVCGMLLEESNMCRIEGRAALNNLRANRTLILSGFQQEGVLRRAQLIGANSIDVNVYSRVRGDGHIVQDI